MVNVSMLKHLMNDDESLAAYYLNKQVDVNDIKRHLFLKERQQNKKLPDHHYRLQEKDNFNDISTFADMFIRGLPNLSNEHFLLRENRIHIKQEKMNAWQEFITFIPPLIMQAAYLFENKPLLHNTRIDVRRYLAETILPNTRYTALPSPHIIQLETYLREQSGLNDLHMHLNGATETDITWQDHLQNPDEIYKELVKGFKNSKVKEQFEQESRLLDPAKYYQLIKVARRIRNYIFDYISDYRDHPPQKAKTINEVLFLINNIYRIDGLNDPVHPIAIYLELTEDQASSISLECTFYILVLNFLRNHPRDLISTLFHYYLLILGLTNRLLVQQTHQYGFEQFQKHTLNGLREFSEKKYRRRFFQMQGNELQNLSFLEGRFSPKNNEKDSILQIRAIKGGWEKLRHQITIQNDILLNSDRQLPVLKLIAHFIKREDINPDTFIRHKSSRIDHWKRAEVLKLLIKNQPAVGSDILGADAAASEFDAPPEVFSPTFRMLRKNGIKHFTYHAGEDFHHIISGLRAIYEAIDFNDLERGDRIGHATATGLSAKQWFMALGEQMLIKQGEWLDNLIFGYHLILKADIAPLKELLPKLINEINNYCWKIYHRQFPLHILERAWLLRKYCPMQLFSEYEEAKFLPVFDLDEWELVKKIRKYEDTESLNLLKLYHNQQISTSYMKIISVDTADIFNIESLEMLQLEILRFMHSREIVIETLPTSNVRIGHHNDYRTYHLWNWAKWSQEGKSIPPIVVGTDDTGIFATNILNEYSNIYCHLISKNHMTHIQSMEFIKQLNENGKIYRFT